MDITDQEIVQCCASAGVIECKRMKRRVGGKLEDSLSMCLTFDRRYLPSEVRIGYEIYNVKPFVLRVLRCFNCQGLGHMSMSCRRKVRCVRCGGPHKFDDCTTRTDVKCCRCRGNIPQHTRGVIQSKLKRKYNQ